MNKYIRLKIKYLSIAFFVLATVAVPGCDIKSLAKKIAQNKIWTAQSEIWDSLYNSFRLTEEIDHPLVEKHVQKLLKNKEHLQKLIEYSTPYLYYILDEVKQRDLPGELALIPMIESAFDPFAHSHAGASGLWQLMPATSTGLGVTRDWWFDGRRDIQQSTHASLQYFEYLNKFFKGNWDLTIAAYNAGEGTVQKAIRKSGHKIQNSSYWSLPLPKETKDYVPKLYALAKIIQNPEQYNIDLPFIPNKPYFKFIKLDSPIELARAAKLADMDLKEFKELNPGHNQWLTKPQKNHTIVLPVEKAAKFEQNISQLSEEELLKWSEHQVKKGESIQKIAKIYKTPKDIITEVNQINTKVKPGETLWIPQRSEKVADQLIYAVNHKQQKKHQNKIVTTHLAKNKSKKKITHKKVQHTPTTKIAKRSHPKKHLAHTRRHKVIAV